MDCFTFCTQKFQILSLNQETETNNNYHEEIPQSRAVSEREPCAK